ncbi:MAG TPA: nuclear transport factor 2 family protein [Casimicrobiaceae bacterium]|nr:nuclear transport factor 2 family protein [Casimicrobiaceae bacterium]
MHANAALVESLYDALSRRDAPAMAACYAPDATFTDPVFDLRGGEVAAMWSMLCSRTRDLAVEWRNVEAGNASGQGDWDARYTFAATGRRVHNRIHSDFTFRAGRIVTQRDAFHLGRWLRMAVGPVAVLPGLSGWLARRVRRDARRTLDAWMAAHAGRAPSGT